MGKIGGGNPIPFELGGGPAVVDKFYNDLKQALGIGGSAEDNTIEATWRLARSRGLRAAYSDDRAIYQWFPNRCTDFIPVWEEVFALLSGSGLSDEERRQNITDRWVYTDTAITTTLETSLQRIDPLFSIVSIDWINETTTVHGRGFEGSNGPVYGGGRSSTEYPNYGTTMICRVFYNIGTGLPSTEQLQRIERAKDLLNRVLSSWVNFTITTNHGSGGFRLGIDRVGLGSFGA